MKRQLILASLVAGSFAVTGSVIAATQGTSGLTSTGTVDVSVDVPDKVSVTGLQDYAFGTWDGSGDLDVTREVCVYSSTGGYSVTGSDDSGSAGFYLVDGSNQLLYQPAWSPALTGSIFALTENFPLPLNTTAETNSPLCEVANTARFRIRILQADLAAAPPGSYAATVTLVIAPE